MAEARGWAVAERDGGIVVDTVSSTRRAAIVNWLSLGPGLVVTKDWTDAGIEDIWTVIARGRTAVEVAITTTVPP